MICTLLIMTMIIINSIGSADQKIRHSETILKEEDMNAKTKAWLLMVESGKVDQEELRRITPKSIFIAPLLTSRTGKCKDGYRHDHLGQCVKVIKIDPKVQLELLLQRLNKMYGEKKEEKEETADQDPELFEVSSGPLHFSLPISSVNNNVNDSSNDTIFENEHSSNRTSNSTVQPTKSASEFISVPLPMVNLNQTRHINETKDFESSGAELLKEMDMYEGSADEQIASGDALLEESSTQPSVSLLFEESDYNDDSQTESTTVSDALDQSRFTTETPDEEFLTEIIEKSYQNVSSIPNSNISTIVANDTVSLDKETIIANNSEIIHFPKDDKENYNINYNYKLNTPESFSVKSSRIRFPDELSKSHPSPKVNEHQSYSSNLPKEQFWWLPKNWQVDENQEKSPLVRIWSRLPLMHDITYSQEAQGGLRKPDLLSQTHPNLQNPTYVNDEFSTRSQYKPPNNPIKPFRNSRFQDIILAPRQNFRFQR